MTRLPLIAASFISTMAPGTRDQTEFFNRIGREYQFAAGDSGRSGDLSAPRRARRRLHIHQRSLSMRDQRQADDCCVDVTVH